MLKYKAPFLYMIGGWKASEFSNISKIPKLKSPVILFHGTSDLIVPSEMSQSLYDAAQPPKKLYLVNGASHVNAMYLARKDLAEDLKEFLPDRGEPVSFQ